MAVLPFRPNWANPVVERLEFRTGILRADDGAEQRQRFRRVPRRGLEFTPFLQDMEAAAFDALMFARQHEAMTIPLWTDAQRLAAQLSAGATQIPVTTDFYSWEAGGQAILIADFRTYEVVSIDTVGAGVLNLAEATATAWPAGTRVLPAPTGWSNPEQPVVRFDNRATTAPIRIECDTAPAVSPGTLGPTYQAHDVMDLLPSAAEEVEETLRREILELDNPLGNRYRDPKTDFADTLTRCTWLLVGREAIWNFRRWLYQRAGRLRPFWMPPLRNNLVLAADVDAEDAEIIIERTGYTDHLNLHPARRDLRFVYGDGTTLDRRIIACENTVTGNREILTLDAAPGVGGPPASFRRVGFLTKCVLDADAVELAWLTDDVVQVQLNVRGLGA
jgi:phage baseplate assembly protein gpV